MAIFLNIIAVLVKIINVKTIGSSVSTPDFYLILSGRNCADDYHKFLFTFYARQNLYELKERSSMVLHCR